MNNGWISVKERLPESDGHYFAACNEGRGGLYVFRFYKAKNRFVEACGVTHWQPLPPPPEPEDSPLVKELKELMNEPGSVTVYRESIFEEIIGIVRKYEREAK